MSNKIREYRLKLVNAGQDSPEELGYEVGRLLKKKIDDGQITKKIKILDVGCGLGANMKIIAQLNPDSFQEICGIDYSPATIKFHKNKKIKIYTEVSLCDSSKLPFKDNAFDIALSMENLEHLYGSCCLSSLNELKRIAKHIIITTPLPADVINFSFLYQEIIDAVLDEVPLAYNDYICLESAVHKSVIYPKSMINAGFLLESRKHGIYYGRSELLKLDLIKYDAIEHSDNENYKYKYINLLAKSASLHTQIVNHEFYEIPEQIPTSPSIPEQIPTSPCLFRKLLHKLKLVYSSNRISKLILYLGLLIFMAGFLYSIVLLYLQFFYVYRVSGFLTLFLYITVFFGIFISLMGIISMQVSRVLDKVNKTQETNVDS
jgi:SAM-dependent methyltransferase